MIAAKKDVWRITSFISPHRTALIAKAMNKMVATSRNPLSRNFVRFVFSFTLDNSITHSTWRCRFERQRVENLQLATLNPKPKFSRKLFDGGFTPFCSFASIWTNEGHGKCPSGEGLGKKHRRKRTPKGLGFMEVAKPLPVVAEEAVQPKVRWAAIGLAFALVAGFSVVSGWAALLRHEILGTGYLPRGVVPLFLVIVLVNALVKKVAPKLALTRTELAFIFALLTAIAAIPGQEFGIHFYLNLLGLVYYSSPQSQWFNLFTPHLSSWLVPSLQFRDPAILWAYEGMPAGGKMPLGEWLIPLIVWTPYLFGIYALLVCLCGLMARQWEEHERLLYPLTQVPMELAGEEGRGLPKVFLSPFFWLGFFAAAVPISMRGLHLYFPQVPDPQLQRTLAQLFGLAPGATLFPSGPLSAYNGLLAHFYPEMVGIAYLLSREVGFSLWFFLLLRHTEIAIRMAVGIDMYHAEFLTFQSIASYIVMAFAILWVARHHFAEIVASTLHHLPFVRTQHPAQRTSESWALIGFVAVFVGLLAWSRWVAGVSVLWAAAMILGLVVAALIVARIVAETGIYIYSAPFRVNQVLFDIFGKDRIGSKNIVLLTAMSWVQIRSTATMASGYLVNSFRLGTLAGLLRSSTAFWILVAILLSLLVCHVTIPTVIYTYSVPKLSWWAQGSSLNTANLIAQYLTTTRPLTAHHWWGLIIGALTCWLLIKLRLTFVGFPLHPLGFVAWYGWPIDRYWLSIFIGWALKSAILRYGGYRSFHKFRPFAYGLIIGGTTALTFWIVLRLFYLTSESIITD
jgi:hypothetical protein